MEIVKQPLPEKETNFLIDLEKKAEWLKEKTIGKPFDVRYMNRVTGISLTNCQLMLREFGQFFLLGYKVENGDKKYMINCDPAWRIEQINIFKEEKRARFEDEQRFFDELIEYITPQLTPPVSGEDGNTSL